MERYKVTLNIESTERYEKAKNDLKQALISLEKLSDKERRVLAEELFGATQVAVAMNVFNKYFRLK